MSNRPKSPTLTVISDARKRELREQHDKLQEHMFVLGTERACHWLARDASFEIMLRLAEFADHRDGDELEDVCAYRLFTRAVAGHDSPTRQDDEEADWILGGSMHGTMFSAAFIDGFINCVREAVAEVAEGE